MGSGSRRACIDSGHRSRNHRSTQQPTLFSFCALIRLSNREKYSAGSRSHSKPDYPADHPTSQSSGAYFPSSRNKIITPREHPALSSFEPHRLFNRFQLRHSDELMLVLQRNLIFLQVQEFRAHYGASSLLPLPTNQEIHT